MRLLAAWLILVTIVFFVLATNVARTHGWAVIYVILGFAAAAAAGFAVSGWSRHGRDAVAAWVLASFAFSGLIIAMWLAKTAAYGALTRLGMTGDLRFHASWAVALLVIVLPAKLVYAHYFSEEPPAPQPPAADPSAPDRE